MENKPIIVNIISESAFTVQGHGVHTAFEEHVASLKKRPDIKVYVNSNARADVVHIHTVGLFSVKHILFDKGKKFISAHVVPDSFVGSLRGAKYWYGLAKLYLRWLYNRADGVCAVSNEVVDQLKKLGIKKPIYLVPNTIDTSQYKASDQKRLACKKDLAIDPETFVVVCSGQVQPRKRVDTFLKCAKSLPEMQFIWIGGIPFKQLAADYKAMEKLTKEHPPNVRFTGVIKHDQVFKYYWASDLFFLPSEQETFGIVVVEAAAAGLPVLLRDNDQYHKTFHNWYAAGLDNSFVRLIKKFAEDKDYYQKMLQKAKNITQTYDSKAGAEEIVGIYKQALGRST